MSTARRVLIVARHYWPTTNDQSLRLRNWVARLGRAGIEAVVVSPRWHPSWPKKVVCDDIVVHRIDYPPTTQLRTSRYWRSLCEWVSRERAAFDYIYCDAANGDAHALLTNLPKNDRPPIYVRFSAPELALDSYGTWSSSPWGSSPWRPSPRCIDACRRATAVIAPTAAANQQLLSCGISQAAIRRLPDLPGDSIDRSPAARTAARKILASINHDLFVRSHDRVVVCPGELTRAWGVDLVIEALGPLVEKHRSLKLWLLGDSIERSRLYDALQFKGLHRVVAMPGDFTCMQPILQAADLLVFPAAGLGLGWLLPTCVANAIPVVAAQSPEARELLKLQSKQLTFSAGEAKALAAWVSGWMRSPSVASSAVSTVRELLVRASVPRHGGDASKLLLPFPTGQVAQDAPA